MKVLVDIEDNKAAFVMELLDSLPFVRTTKPVSPARQQLKKKITSAVKEVNMMEAGKRKGTLAKDFLNAL